MKSHWISLVFAICLALMILGVVPLSQSQSWIDPVTGSWKRQSRYLGFPMSPDVSRSEIERWIVRHEESYRPQWQHLGTSIEMLYGPTRLGCSPGPPIYRLLCGDDNTEFVRCSTDQEIAKFVRIMRTGTEDEQRQAVEDSLMKANRARASLK